MPETALRKEPRQGAADEDKLFYKSTVAQDACVKAGEERTDTDGSDAIFVHISKGAKHGWVNRKYSYDRA